MRQKIFLLGIGNVGIETMAQILEADIDTHKHHKNPTEILGFADRERYVFRPEGIREKIHSKISAKAYLASYGKAYKTPDEIAQKINNTLSKGSDQEEQIIFVDATDGGQSLLNFHCNIIDNYPAFSIVTANKNPLILGDSNSFKKLIRFHKRYEYETTFMADSGIIDFLNEQRNVVDIPTRVDAMLSGSLGYILSAFQKEETPPFSAILQKAIDDGLTEPNPAVDLSGKDVARKLVILARTLGFFHTTLNHIQLTPLFPCEGKSKEALLAELENTGDATLNQFRSQAKEHDYCWRYIASFQNTPGNALPQLIVGLKKYPLDHAFATLEGTKNRFECDTHIQQNYVVEADGAGVKKTAQALRKGIVSLIPWGVPQYD